MLKKDFLSGSKDKKNIIVIHFQPIDKYPPAFNLLRILAKEKKNTTRILLITTNKDQNNNRITIPGIRVHYVGNNKSVVSRFGRMMLYLWFNVKAFFLLVKNNPAAILYYETLSAGAPWLYMKLKRMGCRLFIHYHEYTSPAEYTTGMALNRWLHKCELSLYKKASWVSHTNDIRQKLFLADIGLYAPLHNFVLPNYPPALWKEKNNSGIQAASGKTAFVYIGALDTETMYLKEMAAYIIANADSCYWDIYSGNATQSALAFLEKLQAPNIHFKGEVLYDALPETLELYQVGLIMYKGHIPNYVYNAPNKLFEYAVCGLDVWFPNVMKSCLPYVTEKTWPKIISVNFEALNNFTIGQLTDRKEYQFRPHDFSCEDVLQPLVKELIHF